ncbi:multidrug transporter [Listeria monocytogenes]|nr:multidrug transporter [Listeria monocytogenes]
MSIENTIKALMERKSGNVKNFAESVGLPYTTVRSILERGVLNAKVDNIIKISQGLNIKPEDLLAIENDIVSEIVTISYQLEEDRQHKVYSFAEKQLEEQNKKTVPVVGAIAANPSELEYGDPVYDENISINVPAKADCALIVQGDSMEPLIPNNSIVFYRNQPDVENGEIAVVEIDGNGTTCKKFYFDYEENKVILRSLNEKYEDRKIEPERVRVLGKVISA